LSTHDPILSRIGFDESEKRVIEALRQIGFDRVVQYNAYMERSLQMDMGREEGTLSWCRGAFNYTRAAGMDKSSAPWVLYEKDFPDHKKAMITPCTAMKGTEVDLTLSAMELEELFRELDIRLDLVPPSGRYDGPVSKVHPGIELPTEIREKVSSKRISPSSGLSSAEGMTEMYPCLMKCLTGGGNYPKMDVEWIEHLKEVLV